MCHTPPGGGGPSPSPPPRLERDYLASFSSAPEFFSIVLIISTPRHSCRHRNTYSLLSSPPYPFSRVLHRASSSLLYSFTVVSTRPSTSVLSSSLGRRRTQLRRRGERPRLVCSCVSLSIAHTFSLVCRLRHPPSLARSRSFLPPFPLPLPGPPGVHFGLRFLRALRLFLQPPASVLYCGYPRRARRAGAQKHADAAMLTRSVRSLASPRLGIASLRLWRFFVERGLARHGSAFCPPSPPPPLFFRLITGRRGVVNCASRAAGRVRTCPM